MSSSTSPVKLRLSRRTKIVATLGPVSSSPEVIKQLITEGVNVFRLNFSHGDHNGHQKNIKIIRQIEKEICFPIGILIDLQGPKLRVSTFINGKEKLTKGDLFTLHLDPVDGTKTEVTLAHPEIFSVLKVGHEILIDDGKIRLRIKTIEARKAITEVIVGGTISNRKGVNVPDTALPIAALTEKDRDDLAYALTQNIDWVALSFVQRPDDIQEAKDLIQGRASLLAKLEKPSALEEDNLNNIIELADAVMVARGDLGVELPPERVPSIQKRIVAAARAKGRPVIIATQMLESMITAPIPTRAEASDVATAIYDGADAVMLSAETAAGDFPIETVSVMRKIITETERDMVQQNRKTASKMSDEMTDADAIAAASSEIAIARNCTAIVAFSSTGSTVFRTARVREVTPILGLTPFASVARKLCLVWGVYPIQTKDVTSLSEMVGKSVRIVQAHGIAQLGDKIVITAGLPFGTPGTTNMIRLTEVSSKYDKPEES